MSSSVRLYWSKVLQISEEEESVRYGTWRGARGEGRERAAQPTCHFPFDIGVSGVYEIIRL